MNETLLSGLIHDLVAILAEYGDMPVYSALDVHDWRCSENWDECEIEADVRTYGNDCHEVCILHF